MTCDEYVELWKKFIETTPQFYRELKASMKEFECSPATNLNFSRMENVINAILNKYVLYGDLFKAPGVNIDMCWEDRSVVISFYYI